MSGGTIVRCQSCGRLIIYGQRCTCTPVAEIDCDCVVSGNYVRISPGCNERIRRAWSAAIHRTYAT